MSIEKSFEKSYVSNFFFRTRAIRVERFLIAFVTTLKEYAIFFIFLKISAIVC